MSNYVKYIDVILPLPVKGVFQYSYNSDVELEIGQRVIVQFGIKKLYTAIVFKKYENKTVDFKVKKIDSFINEKPIVNTKQLLFWQWVSKYYLCSIGDVMNAALPSSLKLASESKFLISPEFDGDVSLFENLELEIINLFINSSEISLSTLTKKINKKIPYSIVNNLVRKEVLISYEDINEKFKEKLISYVKINNNNNNLKLSIKQDLLYKNISSLLSVDSEKKWSISQLSKKFDSSRAIFNALIDKNFISIKKEPISRLLKYNEDVLLEKKLSSSQEKALEKIKNIFVEKDVCLLHGVTSSGKTEVYIKLIEDQINKGKQVLYLLPEIALTIQIITRLQQRFGSNVNVFHSNLNSLKRVEIWKALQNNGNKNRVSIILGARSSLFLPFSNLGLIIVDEEHDSSFKQQQPSPRYNARDGAIFLSSLHKAKVLLGSATPSIETYFNASKNKYGFVELLKRYADIKLPKIKLVDIRKAGLKKEMNGVFSNLLITAISDAINNNNQVILFQNRRGFSRVISCNTCAETISCKNCAVSLTFHKYSNKLKCHYCGYNEDFPKICKSCKNNSFSNKSFGTEQVADHLSNLLPNIIVKRMDYDTTRKKDAYKNLIYDFQQKKIDVLVGTQMIAKGLDFDNVSLVGILDADNILNFPDFRSHEFAFQLLTQVSGRSGRKGKQGDVILQTYNPEQELIKYVKNYDYLNFFKNQISERKIFNYPPFARIISITLKHRNDNQLNFFSDDFVFYLKKSFGNRVLGPEYPIISKIRNYYLKKILLKIEIGRSLEKAKDIIHFVEENLRNQKRLNGCIVVIDVDPL